MMRYVLPKPMLRMNLADPPTAIPATTDEGVDRIHRPVAGRPASATRLIAADGQTVLEDPGPLRTGSWAPYVLPWGENDCDDLFSDVGRITCGKDKPYIMQGGLPGWGTFEDLEDPARSLEPVAAFLKR